MKMIKCVGMVFLLLLVATGYGFTRQKVVEDGVKETADAYLKAFNAFDFEKVATFFTDQSVYEDLTYRSQAALEGHPVPPVVKGGNNIKNLMIQSFGKMKNVKSKIHLSFYCGEYAVFSMEMSAELDFAEQKIPSCRIESPAVMVLKIKNRKVIGHYDHYDYDVPMRAMYAHMKKHGQKVPGASPKVVKDIKQISRGYMEAYGNVDVKRMAEYYTDESFFEDKTLDAAMRLSGKKAITGLKGKQAIKQVLTMLLKGYDSVKFDYIDSFYTGGYAIHTGNFLLAIPAKGNLPARVLTFGGVVFLEIKDGKVYRHNDMVDYQSYFEQLPVQPAGQKK
ncbi:MAG: hypothetical protein GY765_30315 [bacterium]|nr:hypothetical protein [bacterium]